MITSFKLSTQLAFYGITNFQKSDPTIHTDNLTPKYHVQDSSFSIEAVFFPMVEVSYPLASR